MTAEDTARPVPQAPDPLPETASLLLDVLRFSLCLLVLAGHMSQGWFGGGWPNMMPLADGAVPGFFVLSGFVIRYVTRTRERDGRRYFASRASRIYSVVLPAIVLTAVLDALTRRIDPVLYRYVLLPTPWRDVPAHIAGQPALPAGELGSRRPSAQQHPHVVARV